jgi:hypothetical protein
MGALGGPKEAIGEKVAAALVGTFLGILLCYGIFAPLSVAMGKNAEAEAQYFGFLRMAAMGFLKDLSPIMSVELARRHYPDTLLVTDDDLVRLLQACERQRTEFRSVRDKAVLAVLGAVFDSAVFIDNARTPRDQPFLP